MHRNETRPYGNAQHSEGKRIDGNLWRRVVPPNYVNYDWLDAGSDLLDGRVVSDESASMSMEVMECVTRLLDARSTVFRYIDSELRRELHGMHAWFSDSQNTFIADFPRREFESCIVNYYHEALAMMSVLGTAFGIPALSDCPLHAMGFLRSTYSETFEDVSRIIGSADPEKALDRMNIEWNMAHGPWFVSVMLDDGVPSFDVFGWAFDNPRIGYAMMHRDKGMSVSHIVLGPYGTFEDAEHALTYYSRISHENLDDRKYLEYLEDIHKKISEHDFEGVPL